MIEAICLIVAVNLFLYIKTLRFKFVSDDFSVWRNPPVAKNAWHKLFLQLTGQMKIYAKAVRIDRVNKKWFVSIVKCEEMEHILTLAIHIGICIGIYFAFGQNMVSLLTALLYSTNPLNHQATLWPAGRGYALPNLFLVLSIAMPLLSPILLWAGCWYTVGFLAPLALIGHEYYWILGSLPIVWALHWKKWSGAVKNKHNTECFDEDKKIHPKKLILGIKTFGFYLFLAIIPFRITFYHNFLQSAAGSLSWKCYTLCRYFWIGLTAILGFGLSLYLWDWSTLHWAFLAFCITIAPFCNIIRANQEIAERFAGLPNVFLMYFLAQLVFQLPYASHVAVAFLAFYATRAFYTINLYRDEYWITELAVAEDRHAWWAWHCRAMKRWETQSYKEALILWVMAKLISPKEFKILVNLASALKMMGNDKEAEEHIKLAEANMVPGQEVQAREFIKQFREGKLPILL
jgi:hypothetical protein